MDLTDTLKGNKNLSLIMEIFQTDKTLIAVAEGRRQRQRETEIFWRARTVSESILYLGCMYCDTQ